MCNKVFKKMYIISGKTNGGNCVFVGFFSKIEYAVKEFLSKYPRFRGKASIKTQMYEELEGGILRSDSARWECIDSFESSRELKQYTEKAV